MEKYPRLPLICSTNLDFHTQSGEARDIKNLAFLKLLQLVNNCL